jgi:prophage tail gpP-like protein
MNRRITKISDAVNISLGMGGEPDLTGLIGRLVHRAASSLLVAVRSGRDGDAHQVIDVDVIQGAYVRRNNDVEHAQCFLRMNDPMQRFVLHGYRSGGRGSDEADCKD